LHTAATSTSDNRPTKPGFNDNENPLLRLFLRQGRNGSPYIDAEQFAAGEKLRCDFESAHLSPRITASYEPQIGAGARHWQLSDNHIERLSDHALAARERFHQALDAVGPELSGILYIVICMASGLEQAEARLALPPRSGKAVLALALTRLARHYGLKQSARKGLLSAWQIPDARPVIPPKEVR
jgi:hypothetical protein